MALQEAMLELEMDAVEVVADLVTEFDRSYSEMAEANKLQYNAYFTQAGPTSWLIASTGVTPEGILVCLLTVQQSILTADDLVGKALPDLVDEDELLLS